MFLSSLLDVSERTTDIVKWVSLGTVFLLLGMIALICFSVKKRTYDAKRIAFAGIAVGLSFALSYAKITPVPYGGSITLASFVPVLIYTFVYGIADGLLAGTIFGLLNFISGPYILTPFTFILDYLLAFASIGVMGLAKKFTQKQTLNAVLGTFCVYALRFLFHWISGVLYFMQDAVWVELPDWAMTNAVLYSFFYQLVYIPADYFISTIVIYALAKTKLLDRLIKIISPRTKKTVENPIASTNDAAMPQNATAECDATTMENTVVDKDEAIAEQQTTPKL